MKGPSCQMSDTLRGFHVITPSVSTVVSYQSSMVKHLLHFLPFSPPPHMPICAIASSFLFPFPPHPLFSTVANRPASTKTIAHGLALFAFKASHFALLFRVSFAHVGLTFYLEFIKCIINISDREEGEASGSHP